MSDTDTITGVLVLGGILVIGVLAGLLVTGSAPFGTQAQPETPDGGSATTTEPPTTTAASTASPTPAQSTVEAEPAGTAEESTPTATDTGTASTDETTPEPLPEGDPFGGTTSLAESDVTITGEGNDEIGFGTAVGDLNGDGTPDVALGAPLHNGTGVQSGAVFVFFGPVQPGSLDVGDANVTITGEDGGDWAGNSIDIAPVDGDGTPDLVVGAPRNEGGGDRTGSVYVLSGGPDLNGTRSLDSADAKLPGVVPGSLTGYSVAAANVTGGTASDLVIGAPRGEDSPGRAYLVGGDRVDSLSTLADADTVLEGEAAGDSAGWSVAAAGGENPVVVVGAHRNDAPGEDAGSAYAVRPPFPDTQSLGAASTVYRGEADGDFAGWSVAAPGDLDGDGRTELLVGARMADPAGMAYLVAGQGQRSLTNATAFEGTTAGEEAGWVVAGADDLDCDGSDDLLVGAPGNASGGADAGAVYAVTATDSTNLANASATFAGEAGDQVGRASALATIPGDNRTGLVVGAPFGETPQTAHIVYTTCPGE